MKPSRFNMILLFLKSIELNLPLCDLGPKFLCLLLRFLKVIFKLGDLVSHPLGVDLMMIGLRSQVLLESHYGPLQVLLLLGLGLSLLLHLPAPPLDLPLVCLERVRYLLDVPEVPVLGLEKDPAFLCLPPSQAVLALFEHGLKHFFVLLVNGLDLSQALIIVDSDAIQVLLVLLPHLLQ